MAGSFELPDSRRGDGAAGNLVFAGQLDGQFNAFNATTGQKLWHFLMGAGVMASPVTY
jgi:hypothetical protein